MKAVDQFFRKMNCKFWILLSWMLFCLATSNNSVGQTCSPSSAHFPGAASDDNSNGGSIAFSNVDNSKTDDNSYATAGVLLGVITTTTTDYLKLTNFGFSIPATAIICGIEVKVDRAETSILQLGQYVKDSRISLIKGGTIQSINYASGTNWGSEAEVTYGGSSDLWSGVWTYSDINSSSFGIVISASYKSVLSLAPVAKINYASVKIYYNNSTLTSEMESFEVTTGNINNKTVDIKWKVGNNDQYNGFVVQRSVNGRENWKNIFSIPSKQGNNIYKVTDEVAKAGKYYYRVGLISKINNDPHFSPVRSLEISEVNPAISLYPNPVVNYITVNNLKKVKGIYRIFNMQGYEVMSGNIKENTAALRLNFQNFPGGIYVLNIDDKWYRFIKQ